LNSTKGYLGIKRYTYKRNTGTNQRKQIAQAWLPFLEATLTMWEIHGRPLTEKVYPTAGSGHRLGIGNRARCQTHELPLPSLSLASSLRFADFFKFFLSYVKSCWGAAWLLKSRGRNSKKGTSVVKHRVHASLAPSLWLVSLLRVTEKNKKLPLCGAAGAPPGSAATATANTD
jgi:hypothetical protein